MRHTKYGGCRVHSMCRRCRVQKMCKRCSVHSMEVQHAQHLTQLKAATNMTPYICAWDKGQTDNASQVVVAHPATSEGGMLEQVVIHSV